MARFSSILSATVVVLACLYMVNLAKAEGSECSNPGDCNIICPFSGLEECCDGLREGVASDGSVYALKKGKCTCCNPNQYCRALQASSLSNTSNTQANSNAADIDCAAY